MNVILKMKIPKMISKRSSFKLSSIVLFAMSLVLFSCEKEIEKDTLSEQQLVLSEENSEISAPTANPFYVGVLKPISIKDTEARIEFTSSQNSMAYMEYGTDVNYGASTKAEESFKYATHRQFIRGLEPGTTYFYKVIVENKQGELATASSSFTTSGNESSSTTPAPFTVGELEPILIEDTEVRIQFRASASAQAYIEYGTDTDYGQQTNGETSFKYAQHRQYIRDLSPGTTYYYRVHVTNEKGEVASASSSFTTLGEPTDDPDPDPDPEPEDPTGVSGSFGQIQSQGLSNGCYLDDEHYVAEFLYQNPEVYFWEVNGSEVIALNTPVPSSNAIQLPKPSGGNDTAALERIINGNSGKDFVGQEGTYRIDNLDINVPANIFNVAMIPARSSTRRIINVTSRNVGIFNSPVDGQNSNSLYVAYEVQNGAHNFTLVESGLKNVYHTKQGSMAGLILRGVNDFHVAGNRFVNLLNDAGGRKDKTARANAIWMYGEKNGGNPGQPTSGGYIVNNYGEEFQSNGKLKDAEFFTIQSYASTDVAKPVRIYANRTVNAGKRLVKFQESNGVVLSNSYEWNVKSGRLGNRALLSHVEIHFSDNVIARNNRVKVGAETQSRFDYLFNTDARNPGLIQDNLHYDCNDILIESTLSPSTRNRPTLITARNTSSSGNGRGDEATNSSANYNVLRGPGSIANVYWFGPGYDDRGGRFQHTGNVYESRMHTRGEYNND